MTGRYLKQCCYIQKRQLKTISQEFELKTYKRGSKKSQFDISKVQQTMNNKRKDWMKKVSTKLYKK